MLLLKKKIVFSPPSFPRQPKGGGNKRRSLRSHFLSSHLLRIVEEKKKVPFFFYFSFLFFPMWRWLVFLIYFCFCFFRSRSRSRLILEVIAHPWSRCRWRHSTFRCIYLFLFFELPSGNVLIRFILFFFLPVGSGVRGWPSAADGCRRPRVWEEGNGRDKKVVMVERHSCLRWLCRNGISHSKWPPSAGRSTCRRKMSGDVRKRKVGRERERERRCRYF